MKSTMMEKEATPGSLLHLISQPLKFRIFLLKNLPAALFSGVKIESATKEQAVVIIPYRWSSKNPFGSTYFACLAMAAEMSTGILAMSSIYKRRPAVSMLVVSMEGNFFKKATGVTRFVCKNGMQIQSAVEEAVATSVAQTVKVLSTGYNKNDELVAEFFITWSFKRKS